MTAQPEPIRTDTEGRQYAPSWVHAVLPEIIEKQRQKGWPDFHPEDFCHRCGRRNPVWWTDSRSWNRAAPERTAILCPSCFAELDGDRMYQIKARS